MTLYEDVCVRVCFRAFESVNVLYVYAHAWKCVCGLEDGMHVTTTEHQYKE